MLKITARRFATLSLAAAALAGTTAYGQQAGITQGDSQTTPRRSGPATGGGSPELDSRTGQGEFARDVTARGAATGDDAHERTSFTGLVTAVGKGSVTLQMAPPRVPTAMEQTFRVGEDAAITVGGKSAGLDAIRRGDTVRIITAAADPEVAVRIVAATTGGRRAVADPEVGDTGDAPREPREARTRSGVAAVPRVTDEDEDLNFDVYPENHQDTPPPRPDQQGGGNRLAMAMQGGEEAVLPLGIEVFAGSDRGALVTEMLDAGPAAAAGVLINDLIMAVNGQTVTDPEMMEQMMAAGNGVVELTVMRNGETMQLQIGQPGVLVDGSLTTTQAMQGALTTAGFIGPNGVLGNGFVGGLVGEGLNNGGVAGSEFLPGGQGVGFGPNGVNQNGVNNGSGVNNGVNGQNGFTPRSPGRSDAARGGAGLGRSDARRGGAGLGRSDAAPGNNRFGAGQNGTGTQNGAGAQGGAGVQGGAGAQGGVQQRTQITNPGNNAGGGTGGPGAAAVDGGGGNAIQGGAGAGAGGAGAGAAGGAGATGGTSGAGGT